MSRDILDRRPIRTAYGPEEWIEAFENAESEERRGKLRLHFRRLDSGRFYEMLDSTHEVLAHSDTYRMSHFKDYYSDRLIKWVIAFGYAENLSKFPKLHDHVGLDV